MVATDIAWFRNGRQHRNPGNELRVSRTAELQTGNPPSRVQSQSLATGTSSRVMGVVFILPWYLPRLA
jgi:hypothetical protein